MYPRYTCCQYCIDRTKSFKISLLFDADGFIDKDELLSNADEPCKSCVGFISDKDN
jgi:hypothetical protein